MAQIGVSCELNRNTGVYATPTWDAIDIVRDVTLNLEKGEADVTTRGAAGWTQRLGTLKDASVDIEIVWEQADADFTALLDSYLQNTLVDIAVMDGPIGDSGNQGLRAEMEIFSFSRAEPIDGAVTASLSLRPTFSSNAPTWMVVP